jgi:NTE family protein
MLSFFFRSIVLFLFLLISSMPQARPKVGLVLSGGGAKGIAHIGVLRWLEEHRIPVDYISGTSIGAYVSGMYALGYSADEIEATMLRLNWSLGYSDSVPRADLSLRFQRTNDKFNVPIDLGLDVVNFEIKLPQGWLQGQSMLRLIHDSIGVLPNFDSFKDLPIPLQIIAADLETQDRVVIQSGNLVSAIRASMSVPGILAPVEMDGKLLVDGGIVDNLPIEVTKAQGADFVIAVDIGSSKLEKKELESAFDAMNQLSVFLVRSNTEEQILKMEGGDLLLVPDVDGMGTGDFSIITPEKAHLGYVIAEKNKEALLKFQVSMKDYAMYRLQKQLILEDIKAQSKRPISEVKVDSKTNIYDEKVKEIIEKTDNNRSLFKTVDDIYALNRFSKVDMYYETLEDKTNRLVIETIEKTWGPDFLYFGLSLEKGASISAATQLSLGYLMTQINRLGGEVEVDAEVGKKNFFGVGWYQPMTSLDDFYFNFRGRYISTERDVASRVDKTLKDENNYFRVKSGVGYNFTKHLTSELGVDYDWNAKRLLNSPSVKMSYRYSGLSPYFSLKFDNRSNLLFPVSGHYLHVKLGLLRQNIDMVDIDFYANSLSDMYYGEQDPNHFLYYQVNYNGSVDFGANVFSLSLDYEKIRSLDDDEQTIPALSVSMYRSYLGGFLNLSGYHRHALSGEEMFLSVFTYKYTLTDQFLGLPNTLMFFGLSGEAGNVWNTYTFNDTGWELDTEKRSYTNLILATSAFLGADTALGPVILGVGANSQDEWGFYLNIGKRF